MHGSWGDKYDFKYTTLFMFYFIIIFTVFKRFIFIFCIHHVRNRHTHQTHILRSQDPYVKLGKERVPRDEK